MLDRCPARHIRTQFTHKRQRRCNRDASNPCQIHARDAIEFGSYIKLWRMSIRFVRLDRGWSLLLCHTRELPDIRFNLLIALTNQALIALIQRECLSKSKEMLITIISFEAFRNHLKTAPAPIIAILCQGERITLSRQNSADDCQSGHTGYIRNNLV